MNSSTIVENTPGCFNSDRIVWLRSSPLGETRRHTRDNKFQRLEADTDIDVLVLYVTQDQPFIDQQLLPLLKTAGIRYDFLHDQMIEADSLFFQTFGQMLINRSRVLFVLSSSFAMNKTFSTLTSVAVRIISKEKVVCLLVDDNVKLEDDLRFFSSCAHSVLCSNTDWETYLLKLIRTRSPDFIRMIDPCSVYQRLQQHGLDTRHMKFGIYGLFVELDKKTLRIDVEAFRQHLGVHASVGTHLVCAECSLLRTPSSTVSLVFKNDPNLTEDNETFDRITTYLCSNILDILSPRRAKINFTLGCTLMGLPLRDRSYIRKLWLNIMLKGFPEVIAKEPSMAYPENESEDVRFATFPPSWPVGDVPPARSLAQAGFFFWKRPHATRCFMCGFYFGTWRKDDDPRLIHAVLSNFCPFVQENMTDVCIQNTPESYISSEYQVDHVYESLESRMTSFEEIANQLFAQDRIRELANAGFYYTGMHDIVACHACGIMLTAIAANKRVMATHTRLSPSCPYIKATKGDEYIQDILDVVEDAVPQTTVTFILRKFDQSEDNHKDMFLFASNSPHSE